MYTVHTEYKTLKYTKQSVFESLDLKCDFFFCFLLPSLLELLSLKKVPFKNTNDKKQPAPPGARPESRPGSVQAP